MTCISWAALCWPTIWIGGRPSSPMPLCRPIPRWWVRAGGSNGWSGWRCCVPFRRSGSSISAATNSGSMARSARTMPRSNARCWGSAAGPTAIPPPSSAWRRISPAPARASSAPGAISIPIAACPGPAIGFLQECVRWWDRWLKDKPTGVEEDPTLRLWLQDSVPPQSHYDYRPGRWIGIDSWPAPEIEPRVFALNPGSLEAEAGEEPAAHPALAPDHRPRRRRMVRLWPGQGGAGAAAGSAPRRCRLARLRYRAAGGAAGHRRLDSGRARHRRRQAPGHGRGAAQRRGARWCRDPGQLRHPQSHPSREP